MEFWLKKTEEELKLRNYSPKTLKSYIGCLKEYFSLTKGNFDVFDKEKIKQFLLQKRSQNYSPQTVNLYLNAITFFYRQILKKPEKLDIKFAKKSKSLPVVLTRHEINRMLDSIQNKKHKLLIALAYSAGLRVSEVINLKAGDVYMEELTLHIKQSKGRRDRITVFSKKLHEDLMPFLVCKKKEQHVFESERGGRLTTRTAQKIFDSALKKTGILKLATFHSLRHSFATHLIEDGVNIRYVQELLGHQNIRTTQTYTQVTALNLKNIRSPL